MDEIFQQEQENESGMDLCEQWHYEQSQIELKTEVRASAPTDDTTDLCSKPF